MQPKSMESFCYHAVCALNDGVIITNTQGNVLFLNRMAERMIGWEYAQAVGKPIDDILVMIDEQHLDRYLPSIPDIMRDTVKLPDYLLLINRDLNQDMVVSGKGSPVADADGSPLGIVLILYDVTLQRQREAKIRYYSFYDSLTGLYNRSFFDEELKRLDTERMLPLSLIMGDTNGLKLINDTFGHLEGDRLLKEVARVLKEVCRKEDIIARIGGDEFVMILPHVDREGAESIIRRIRENCCALSSIPIRTSISLGCATKEDSFRDIKSVFKQAEEEMYSTKLNESRSVCNEIIASIRQSLEEHADETREHGNRMKELVREMGQRMNLSAYELNQLEMLALIHDIGKIAIPKSVLFKPGTLEPEEWHIMQKHCEIGYRTAAYSPELVSLADAILSHHEHWDGKGYPQGLSGEQIPLISRILSIADAYDVLTNGRSYRKPVSSGEALREIQRCAGTQFDPGLAEIFLSMLEEEQGKQSRECFPLKSGVIRN